MSTERTMTAAPDHHLLQRNNLTQEQYAMLYAAARGVHVFQHRVEDRVVYSWSADSSQEGARINSYDLLVHLNRHRDPVSAVGGLVDQMIEKRESPWEGYPGQSEAVYPRECVLPITDGGYLCAEGALDNPDGTSYVRVCDAKGLEEMYWNEDEWADAPAEVMGAILGALAGMRRDA